MIKKNNIHKLEYTLEWIFFLTITSKDYVTKCSRSLSTTCNKEKIFYRNTPIQYLQLVLLLVSLKLLGLKLDSETELYIVMFKFIQYLYIVRYQRNTKTSKL